MRFPFSRTFFVTLLAAGSLEGCSLVADADSYRLDLGCDLQLDLLGFDAPHGGMTVVVQVDAPDPDAQNGLRLAALARLDGVEPGRTRFQIPMGIPTESALLDFYVDNSEPSPDATYNPQNAAGTGRGDHSWTLRNTCRNGYNEFAHVAQFDDFPVTPGLDEPLVFELRGFDVSADPVEIRVIHRDPSLDAVDGDGTGAYTRAFLHVSSATETGGSYVANPLRSMLDRGVDFDVEVFVDRDGDQVVDDSSTANDPADEGFVFHFAVPPASGGALPIPQDPTTDGGRIVLDRAVVGSDDHSGAVGVVTIP